MNEILHKKSQESSDSTKTFTIATLNIAHGRGQALHQIVCSRKKIELNCSKIQSLLHTINADIVFLQEIDFKALWTNNIHQPTLLNPNQLYPHYCIGNNQTSYRLLPDLHYGNAILSKYHLHNAQNFIFTKNYLGGKGFLHTAAQVHTQKINLINLHLHPFSTKKRKEQLKQIKLFLETINQPIIIGGDFNTSLQDKDLQNFIETLHLHNHPQINPTFRFFFHEKQIDHFFASQEIQWLTSSSLDHKLSDHQLLLNTFTIKN